MGVNFLNERVLIRKRVPTEISLESSIKCFNLLNKLCVIVLLSFSGSLNNGPCLTRPTFIELNPNELHYYLFMIILDRYNGIYNTLDDLSSIICVTNKTKNVNLNLFNMIT